MSQTKSTHKIKDLESKLDLKLVDPRNLDQKKKEEIKKSLGIRSVSTPIKDRLMVIAEKQGKPVGCMSFIPNSKNKSMFIEKTHVKAKERRKGIGSKMAETAENVAKEVGIKKIHGHIESEGARELFKKKGFQVKTTEGIEKAQKKIKAKKEASLPMSMKSKRRKTKRKK